MVKIRCCDGTKNPVERETKFNSYRKLLKVGFLSEFEELQCASEEV